MPFSVLSFATQLGILVLALAAHKPLGSYLARTFSDTAQTKHYLPERMIYRLAGIDAASEQRWSMYLRSVLVFSIIGVLLLFLMQRLQGLIPGQGAAVDPWIAMNTAISFVTNTNWQSYAPESTLGLGT